MNTHIDSLIGKHVVFTVSEPWDYVSPYGDVNLYGKILSLRDNDNGDKDILCEMKPFVMEGRVITEAFASKRHQLEKSLAELLLTTDWGVSVNVGCEHSVEQTTQKLLSGTVFLFIGEVKLLNIERPIF